jgi:hypothetical protein
MEQSISTETRYLRPPKQQEVLAPRSGAMITAARERIRNTRGIISQSQKLLKTARAALDSSKHLRMIVKRISLDKN